MSIEKLESAPDHDGCPLFALASKLRDAGHSKGDVLAALATRNASRWPALEKHELESIADTAFNRVRPSDAGHASKVDLITVAKEAGCLLFKTPDRKAGVVLPRNGHVETLMLDSSDFRNWLNREFHTRAHTLPSEQILNSALSALRGEALFNGETKQVFIRIASLGENFYLDLCNDAWEVVEINASGWRVTSGDSVRFIRTQQMEKLPTPIAGGDISDLLDVVNIREADLPIVLAVLVYALKGSTPFPILELIGEQGSAKSTTQKVLRRLIDPNIANVRGLPRRVEDVFIAAANNFIVSYDNVSHLNHDLQDVLCQIATGSGYARRQNYTDFEEAVVRVGRPVFLSGIGNVATNSDLISRTLTLELPEIKASARKTEDELEERFAALWPYLLGALLNLMAKTLKELPSVTLQEKPRLADFARLGEALCKAGGFGSFSKLLTEKGDIAAQVAIEASPVAHALLLYARDKGPFLGTVQQLLFEVSLPQYRAEGEAWVKSAKGFSDAIRRAKPDLARLGVRIAFKGKSRIGQLVEVRYLDSTHQPSRPSQPSPLAAAMATGRREA